MDLKSGPVTLHLRPAKGKTALVSVGFKATADAYLVQAALNGSACLKGEHADQSALLAALFLNAQDRVVKSIKDESASGVYGWCCAYQNGEFIITAECDASGTTIRKTLGGILDGLNPAKVYQLYMRCLRAINGVPSKDAFSAASHEVAKGLGSVDVFVGGKAFGKAGNESRDTVKSNLDKAVKKFDPEASDDKGTSRNLIVNTDAETPAGAYYMTSAAPAASPDAAVYAWSYISGDVPGACVSDRRLMVPASSATFVKKMSDKKDLIQKQIEGQLKQGNGPALIAAVAARHCLLNVSDLVKTADRNITAAATATAVAGMF